MSDLVWTGRRTLEGVPLVQVDDGWALQTRPATAQEQLDALDKRLAKIEGPTLGTVTIEGLWMCGNCFRVTQTGTTCGCDDPLPEPVELTMDAEDAARFKPSGGD